MWTQEGNIDDIPDSVLTNPKTDTPKGAVPDLVQTGPPSTKALIIQPNVETSQPVLTSPGASGDTEPLNLSESP